MDIYETIPLNSPATKVALGMVSAVVLQMLMFFFNPFLI